MEERNVGKSGLRVSVIGLGCNNFGHRLDLIGTRGVVHRALDLGITLFDTADIYGDAGASESYLGQILGDRRKDIVLATKFGMAMGQERLKGGSRRYILTAVEASLRRLKTEWIDLYQMHRPDPLTPIEETLRTLDDLVRQGKVRYIGCSNLAAWQVVDARWTSRVHNLSSFVSCQDEYSLIARGIERDLVPAIELYGIGLLAYCPLAGGFLTGKYKRHASMPAGARLTSNPDYAERYVTDSNWRMIESLSEFAEKRGHTFLEMALSWLVSRSYLSSVIAGATQPDQLEMNVRALDWRLCAEDLREISIVTAS